MQKTEITFCEATASEARGVLTLLQQVATETDYLIINNFEENVAVESLEQSLTSSLESSNCLCLLAMSGDKVIGILNIKAESFEAINHIGDIFIAIQKDYWGHGIGRILLEEGILWAQYSGIIRRLELTVQARNERAVHLYQSLGFTIEGIKKRGIKSRDGEFRDVYLMAKLIEKEIEL